MPRHRLLVALVLLVAPLIALPAPAGAQLLIGVPDNADGSRPRLSVSALREPATGDIRVWFSSGDEIYYNVWRDTDGDDNYDTWALPQNVRVLREARSDPTDGISIALGSVLRGDARFSGLRYRHPLTSQMYRYVMYFVAQLGEDNGVIAGHVCLAFSNDGLSWTHPLTAVRSGGTPRDCNEQRGEILAEEVAAFHAETTTLQLMVIEGDLTEIANRGTHLTNTYYNAANAINPHILFSAGELTAGGVQDFRPGGSFDPYKMFLNLDAGWEPITNTVLMLRTLPYPFDLSTRLPCGSGDNSLATFPNRGQVYKMAAVSGSNLTNLVSPFSSWQLVHDFGGPDGWSAPQNGCQPYPLSSSTPDVFGLGQRNVGLDIDFLNVVKTPEGWIWWRRPCQSGEGITLITAAVPDREDPSSVKDLYWGRVLSSLSCQ